MTDSTNIDNTSLTADQISLDREIYDYTFDSFSSDYDALKVVTAKSMKAVKESYARLMERGLCEPPYNVNGDQPGVNQYALQCSMTYDSIDKREATDLFDKAYGIEPLLKSDDLLGKRIRIQQTDITPLIVGTVTGWDGGDTVPGDAVVTVKHEKGSDHIEDEATGFTARWLTNAIADGTADILDTPEFDRDAYAEALWTINNAIHAFREARVAANLIGRAAKEFDIQPFADIATNYDLIAHATPVFQQLESQASDAAVFYPCSHRAKRVREIADQHGIELPTA